MGLFSRRQDRTEREAWIASTMQRILAERGHETTFVVHPEHGPLLESTGGQAYLLTNLNDAVLRLSDRKATALIGRHVDGLLRAVGAADPSTLTPEQLSWQIRTRLLHIEDGSETLLDYARPFAEGIVEALCLDRPDAVSLVVDQHLPTMQATLDQLFAWGRRNTMSESIDERLEPAPGVQMRTGGSLFIGSKAVALDHVFGPAPFGRVFAVPHRHALIAASLVGPDAAAVEAVVSAAIRLTRAVIEEGAPGGVVSPHLYFQDGATITRITTFTENGGTAVSVSGAFKQALIRATSAG